MTDEPSAPQSSARGDALAAGATPPLVWILEDSPLQARQLLGVLAPSYRTEHFDDGARLLESLSGGEDPDVLILDWEVPGLGGMEVCRFVRQGRDELSLPILMHTGTRNDPQSLLDAFAAGINDFLPKGSAPLELLARLRSLVRVRHLYAHSQDLHARSQRAEREREEAIRALEAEAVLRERFVAVLGHDLRSPLSAILMSARLQRLEHPADSPAGRLVSVVERSGKRMERMVTDLLDFARGRSDGGMPIARGATDLAALCRHALDEVSAGAPGAEIRFTAATEERGRWDADRIEQVVVNLVVNALAHRVPGTAVEVTLRDEGAAVVLDVANEGSIPSHLLADLFEPFRRGPQAGGSTRGGGLGLGLYIVRAIVEAHEGRVAGWSDGAVTTFRVTLPRAA